MNKELSMTAINKWVFFCWNYPYEFIKKVWDGQSVMQRHLEAKFNEYYKTYGSGAVMNKFYCELDGENQQKLMAWVLDNYNDERKLKF